MLETGTILQDRYRVVELIGKGGMGAVYKAFDQRLGSTVALKENFFSNPMLLAAFEREARLLAGLRHAALPKVIDHFSEGDGQFLVMEFIVGEGLEDMLQQRGAPFQTDEVLRWADQLLDALDYLHSQDPPIIHRDIKPQNLKLTSRSQIVLLDFGLAKGTATGVTKTDSNKSLFGYTTSYAPLEQIQGAGTDAQSDLYSLAATLYHLLTGTVPVDAITRAGAILNGKADPLVSASTLNLQVPLALSTTLRRAMALKRDERPSSALQMRKMLRNVAHLAPGTAEGQTNLLHTETRQPDTGAPPPSTQVLASGKATAQWPKPQPDPHLARTVIEQKRPIPAGAAWQGNYNPVGMVTAAPRQPATAQFKEEGQASRTKFIAIAVVLVAAIVLAFVINWGTNNNSPSASQNVANPNESAKNPNQTGAGTTTPVSTPVQSTQYDASLSVSNERAARAEESPATKAADAAKEVKEVEKPEVKQETQQAEAKREASPPETRQSPVMKQEAERRDPPTRPDEPGRDDPMRRPPPPPPPPPPGMPLPHEMPPHRPPPPR